MRAKHDEQANEDVRKNTRALHANTATSLFNTTMSLLSTVLTTWQTWPAIIAFFAIGIGECVHSEPEKRVEGQQEKRFELQAFQILRKWLEPKQFEAKSQAQCLNGTWVVRDLAFVRKALEVRLRTSRAKDTVLRVASARGQWRWSFKASKLITEAQDYEVRFRKLLLRSDPSSKGTRASYSARVHGTGVRPMRIDDAGVFVLGDFETDATLVAVTRSFVTMSARRDGPPRRHLRREQIHSWTPERFEFECTEQTLTLWRRDATDNRTLFLVLERDPSTATTAPR